MIFSTTIKIIPFSTDPHDVSGFMNTEIIVEQLFIVGVPRVGDVQGGINMEVFAKYLAGIDHPKHRERVEKVLTWIQNNYPNLKPEIKWNQPMFTDHGTFIIGLSVAKKHLAVAPESAAITHVKDDIEKAGYDYTKQLIRIPWDHPIDYSLLEKIIKFNISDKADCTTFWRK